MKYKNKSKHVNIIEQIAIAMEFEGNNERYLELGIDRAHCFHAVAPHFKESYAVDRSQDSINKITVPVSLISKVFPMTTDEYFEKYCKEMFDLIFVDARHKWENVRKDFDNAINHIKEDGLIIVHDTYSPNKAFSKHCVDAWKLQPYVRKSYIGLQYINLPFYFGISIIKKDTVKKWWYGSEE